MISTGAVERPRVVIADDEALFRYVIRRTVERDCEVIGEAENGAIAVQLAEELRPDIVLLDISMPTLNGLEAASRIKERLPEAAILIVSSHTDAEYVEESFRRGAHGYVFKASAEVELGEAIKTVLTGRVVKPRDTLSAR